MEKQRLTSASKSTLPSVSEIDDLDTVKQVQRLLKEASALKAKVSEAEDRLAEIRDELSAVCEAYGGDSPLKGFRSGLAGFEYHGYVTRKALNKEKLVTLVPAEVIDQCYTEGAPFLLAKFVVFDLE